MHSDPAVADRAARLDLRAVRGFSRRPLRGLGRLLARGRGITLLLVALLGMVRVWDPLPVEIVRLRTFDFMQRLLPVDDTPPVVPVIAIDEASLKQYGQWPWSRRLLSELVAKLMQAGAVVVGFDIVFAEADRMSPANLAKEVTGLDPDTVGMIERLPDNDTLFAQTLKRSRVVLARFGKPDGEETTGLVAPKATFGYLKAEPDLPDPGPLMFAVGDVVASLPELEIAASGIGYTSLQRERDTVVRRVASVFRIGDVVLPSLSIEMLRVATGQQTLAVKVDYAGITALTVAGVDIPVDRNGRMWLRALRRKPERYIPAADFLSGKVDPARIRGHLVLVGATAAGLQDLRTTSLESNLPGVEVHAHLIENAIAKRHLVRPHYAPGMELVITVASGLLLIVFLPMLGARWTLGGLVVVSAGIACGAYYLLRYQLLLADPSYPIASAAVVYTFLVYASHISEERQRLFIRNAFGQYLSPTLVERLAEEPDSLKLGGETREMTFLFSDVRGFTSISEGYKSDPQALTRLINLFLTPMTNIIMAMQGTIDKYMGDCIMAFWNAPIDDAAHARHGCDAALAMMDELAALNGRLQSEAEAEGRDFVPLRIGVGVNTGECVVGNMGSEQRFDYSVLGDAVNLASRLEGLSKVYGTSIIIGEDTQRLVPEMAWLELDLIAVKGRHEAIAVFTLLGDAEVRRADNFRRLEAKQNEMLAAYRAREWARVEALLAEIRGMRDGFDDFCDAYLERIAFYRENPPGPDWDFVYVAETK